MKLYNIFLFKYLNVVKFSSQNNNLKYIFVRNNLWNFDLPDWLVGSPDGISVGVNRWVRARSSLCCQFSPVVGEMVWCSSTNYLRAKNTDTANTDNAVGIQLYKWLRITLIVPTGISVYQIYVPSLSLLGLHQLTSYKSRN